MTDSAMGFQYTSSQGEHCKSMYLSKRFATMTQNMQELIQEMSLRND